MRKVALVFLLAVFAPSLVLAWLAVRSVRDQQVVLEQQRTRLCQGVADGLAHEVAAALAGRQRDFAQQVEALLAGRAPFEVAREFDPHLREAWPLAQVGFAVLLDGTMCSPTPFGRGTAREFLLENERFLTSRETLEVIWNSPKGAVNLTRLDQAKDESRAGGVSKDPAGKSWVADGKGDGSEEAKSVFATKAGKVPLPSAGSAPARPTNAPPAVPATGGAGFRQLIGDSTEGTLARFLQDKLMLLFWYRPPREPRLVFGAQLNLDALVAELRPLIHTGSDLEPEIAVALLDDNSRPMTSSPSDLPADWKHPFVASAIGEVLPHWQVGVWLRQPARLSESADTVRLTLGLLIGVLVLAIAMGGGLIVADLRRQLALARQKTDFVSNVSHELKTPLTSIRMFAEMLAERRVSDPAKQRFFLRAITSETARLSRLINNVLDFSRLERGEQKYRIEPCDLAAVVNDTVESYRPHLEATGFTLVHEPPGKPMPVRGDADALAQVLVNLISNAEKYAGSVKEIIVRLTPTDAPSSSAEVSVLDRGPGVARGCEDKIFEQFFRAHDSLSSGIQGAGLGLTLARQIARAHGGDVTYQPRDGGGSCFTLRLPLNASALPARCGAMSP